LEDTTTPPRAISQDPPLGYPREFRDEAISGLVVVQCIITDTGRVRACRHRSGPDGLGEYVMSIVRQWRFEPARDHDGEPVVTAYTFRIPFRLRD
jgi:TonB family protein